MNRTITVETFRGIIKTVVQYNSTIYMYPHCIIRPQKYATQLDFLFVGKITSWIRANTHVIP